MFEKFNHSNILKYLERKLILEQPKNLELLRALFAQYSYYKHYPELEVKNRVEYENLELLENLPDKNVMFVSNHTTYYMDTALIYRKLILSGKHSILFPKTNISTLVAEETLTEHPNKRILEYAGCIPIKRQWKEGEKEKERGIDVVAVKRAIKALDDGWLINFPTGTTEPQALVRPGTANYIKKTRPVVVPVYIEGAKECFGKTSIQSQHNTPSDILVVFKDPLEIDYLDPPEVINAQISCAIRNP